MKKYILVLSLVLGFYSQFSLADNIMDETLNCHGTEPFWSLRMDVSKASDLKSPVVHELQFSVFGREEKTIFKNAEVESRTSANDLSIFVVYSKNMQNPSNVLSATFDFATSGETLCNDGMSDHEYPYSTTIRLGDAVYSGCCSSNFYPARP